MTDQIDENISAGSKTEVRRTVSVEFLKIYELLAEIKEFLTKYVDGIANGSDEGLKSDHNLKKIKGFAYKKIDDCIDLLLKNYEHVNDKAFLEFLKNDVLNLHSSVLQLRSNTPYEISVIFEKIRSFLDSFRGAEIGIIALKNANTIINNELKPRIEEVKEKVKDFDSLRLALEHRETSSIYLELHDKYEEEYEENNSNFYKIFGITIFLTIISILYSAFSELNLIVFISVKVLILAVGITLCTLFLRRAAHAKKLKEQAYQTHVEINAFPIHVRSLKDEDKQELIKELALKYFGKELDHTQNDKIGDLMQDQLVAGTELIRASAEMLKAKQVNGEQG